MDLSKIAEMLVPTMNKYIPHKPFSKQVAFLSLPQRQALYGGALGGGKSDALLMHALLYVNIPGYSALILRKHFTDLTMKGAILDRMQDWMRPWIANKVVKYRDKYKQFIFPTWDADGNPSTPSTIQFGFIGESNARTRYQGAELQFIGWDELTQHNQEDYKYLITRLRKCVCPSHPERDANNRPIYRDNCQTCQWAKEIPLKIRSTCNPDGVGFRWVKEHFGIAPNMTADEAERKNETVKWIGHNPDRPFIPASFRDNPFIDSQAYEEELRENLSPEMYEALVNGSWGVLANARFKERWKNYYSIHGKLCYIGNAQQQSIDLRTDVAEIIMTMDSASSVDEGPGDTQINPTKNPNPSWTVMCIWYLLNNFHVMMMHMVRVREEIPVIIEEMRKEYKMWQPNTLVIEENGIGRGVAQYASHMGMNVKGVVTEKDKVVNATNAIVQMEKRRFLFPMQYEPWMDEVNEEVFTWQGQPKETDDIVDNFSLVANYIPWGDSGQSEFEVHNPGEILGSLPIAVYPIGRYDY